MEITIRNMIMIYERLSLLREQKEITQAKLAEKLNIAQNTYSQYENGKRDISTDALKKLAIYYNTSVDYLIDLTDEKKPYPRKTH